ncbi:MAG: hypothetical protein QXP59_00650 [Saccharolobus sp.]
MNRILFELFAIVIMSLLFETEVISATTNLTIASNSANTSNSGNISTNTIISSLSTVSTPIPVAYRALILISLIIILITIGYKFFGLFIKAIFLIAIIYLIVTLILGIVYTGTLTLKYSITYIQIIYNFFIKGYAVASSVGNVTGVIGNATK